MRKYEWSGMGSRRCLVAIMLILTGFHVADSLSVAAAQPRAPAQDEFVPLDQVPPEDQLPAAPLLVAADAIVWLLVCGYLWSIWCRLTTGEKELETLSRRKEE